MQAESEINELIEQLDKRLETLRELSKSPDFVLTIKETLESLGKEAEIAIQNALLHEDLAKRVQELTALQEIAKAITSTVDLPEDLQKIAASAVNLVGGDAFSSSLYLYDRDKDEFRPGAAAGEIDVGFLKAHRPSKDGIGREALRKNKPIFSADPNRINPRMRESGVKAAVCFPLVTDSGPVGLLYVHFRTIHGDGLTDSEKRILATFADQAAIAIEIAQLFEQRAEEMALLHEIGIKVETALKVEDVLRSIVEGAMRLTGTEAGVIHLVSEEGEIIHPLALPPEFAHPVPRFAREEGLTHHIIKTGEPVIITDTSKDDRVNPAVIEKGVKSMVGFPLKLEDKIIGVLYLNDFCSRQFSEREISLLSFLASQVVAIQRAQIYEERVEELQRAQETIIAEQRAAMMSSIGSVFAHRMGNLAGWIPDTVRQTRKRISTEDKYLMDNLDLLERGAERLVKMAESLDKLGKPGPLELVEIDSLLALALKHVKIPKSIQITQDYASDLPLVRADKSFLLEVFVNLITNAIEAMPPQGGRLGVYSRLTEGKWIEAEVTDTGCGMSKKVLEELFTPFFSTKKGGGMGIGLWGSRLFVQRLGGDILVRSREGEGSTFTVRLPAAE